MGIPSTLSLLLLRRGGGTVCFPVNAVLFAGFAQAMRAESQWVANPYYKTTGVFADDVGTDNPYAGSPAQVCNLDFGNSWPQQSLPPNNDGGAVPDCVSCHSKVSKPSKNLPQFL